MNVPSTKTPAGIFRRLLAVLYDSILIIGLYMSFVILITYLNGKALESDLEKIFLQLSFVFITISFFCYFWKANNGQTLGMQVWKIRLISENKTDIEIKTMILRSFYSIFFTIFLFSNFIYIFLNKEKKTLGDKLSKTRIIRVY
jgi:uncharacterized RDD family membrane protein YckC